jgi:hypothetical protein
VHQSKEENNLFFSIDKNVNENCITDFKNVVLSFLVAAIFMKKYRQVNLEASLSFMKLLKKI